MTNDLTAIRAQMEALDGHTSGPWHDDLGETYRAKSADGMNIATANWVTLLGRLPSAEVKQNIGLIAAAPDMRETILALCDTVDTLRAENERLKRLLDMRGTGPAERYWEGRWRDEAADNERLRAALQDIADGIPTPERAEIYRADGKPSKLDKCCHGLAMYEECGECVSDFARAALGQEGGEA